MMPNSSKSKFTLFLQFSLLLAFVVVVALSGKYAMFPGEQIVGAVLLLAGAVVLFSAVSAYRKTMGTLRVKVAPDPAEHGGLITGGIYSKIRHPFYAATPLILTGTALIMRRPWALAMIPLIVGFLYFKSSFEEKLLTAKFPEYVAYKAKTGRFLPRLKK